MSDFAVEAPAPTSAAAPVPSVLASPAGRPLPGRVAALVAAAAGTALWLAFPGTDQWPLAVVGVGGLAVAARGQRPGRGAWLGLITGLTFFGPHLHWSGVYVGTLPWVALATLEAGYLALLGAALPSVWRARGGVATTILGTSGLWVAQEALRGRTPFGGFPWGRLAFSQADAPTLGYAALGGAPLVSAAVAAAGAGLAVAVVALIDAALIDTPLIDEAMIDAARPGQGRLRALRRAGLTVAAGLAAAIAVPALGAAVPRPVDAARSAQIAAVQGDVPTAGLDFNAQRRAVLDRHAQATFELARRVAAGTTPAPQVVLWPENASDIDPLLNRDAAQEIQQAVDAVHVPILVGAVLEQPVGHLSNAGIVWGPTGSAAAGPGSRYLKRHPAPFGEYIPFRSFFRTFSSEVDRVPRDFVAGDTVGVLPANGVTLGDVICFEVAYDELVRDPVLGGADLLVVQTNNATFGYTDESVQQLAMSRLRAVETGRSVVHISTVGVSALIAPDGSMVARSGHFTQQVLQAALPLRTAQTLATRLGGLPEIVLAGLGLLVAASAALRGRRRRADGSAR